MKHLLQNIGGSCLLTPGTSGVGTLTITGLHFNLTLDQILLVTNVTSNTIIYNFSDPTAGGTLSNNVLTLNYNTSAMSSSDVIQVWVDIISDPTETIPISVVPFVSGQQPVSLSQPVALANEQIYDFTSPITSLYAPPVGTILAFQDCLQYRSLNIQVVTLAGISAGAIIFEGSNTRDYGSWVPIFLTDGSSLTTASQSTLTLAASTVKFLKGPIELRYFRARVSTAVVGGVVSISVTYRMTPFAQPLNPVVNVGQWNGTAVTASAYPPMDVTRLNGSTILTAGLAGTVAVGGNVAPGNSPTTNPVLAGGVDSATLVRRFLVDAQGHQISAGPDPSKLAATNPVKVREVDSDLGRNNPAELLEMILMELRLQSFYLKELPFMLSQPGMAYKEELSDFINNVDKF